MTQPDERLALRSESTDPRAIRTRKALVDATIAHLRERPAVEMSVSQVAKDAGVSRQVFYQHFPDLDSLIYTAGQQILGGAYESFASNFESAADFAHAVEKLSLNLADDYAVLIHLMDSPVHSQLDAYVYDIMLPTLHDEIQTFLEERGIEHSEETISVLARFFVAGAQELLEDGARQGMKAEELAGRVAKVVEVLQIR